MTPNEVADELQKMLEDKSALFGWEIRCVENAEAMLRTIPALQAEIGVLKQKLKWLEGFIGIVFKEPIPFAGMVDLELTNEGKEISYNYTVRV